MMRFTGPLAKVCMAVALAFTVGTSTGCARLVAGGIVAAQALIPISTEQEIKIGEQAVREMLQDRRHQLYEGEQLNAYVDRVGMRLAKASTRPDLPWEFYILKNDVPNAIALPGGKIMITTGALKLMENEAQLAAILGHEVAHVAERHSIDQLKRLMVARGVFIGALGDSPQAAQLVGQLAAQAVLAGFSREQEIAADRLGTVLIAQQNYEPKAMVAVMQQLAAQGGGGGVPLFASHPNFEERIAAIQEVIQKQNLQGTVTEPQRYQRMIAPL